VAYFQYLGERPPRLFFRKPFTTLLIDITREPDTILAEMQKTVRYKIRRADGEGLTWETGVDAREFVAFHEAFAKGKGIEGIDLPRIRSFGDALVLTRVAREGTVLAQHAHLLDASEGRARLVLSSSGRFEGGDPALIGRANRWCHWKDILEFRQRGIRTYDLGGFAPETTDPTLTGINDFKLGFGGRQVLESHWFSPLYALAMKLGGH
jgi:hypothetical protein